MSQQDKRYDAIASVLNALYNFSDKVFQYQKDKEVLAESFASTIDNLTILARKREKFERMKHNLSQEERKKQHEAIEEEFNKEEKKLIDNITIVKGLNSAPAGNVEQFLLSASIYLRHKNNEKVKALTMYYIQDLRDAYLVMMATDRKIWDLELRKTMQSIIALSSNISASIRKDGGDSTRSSEENEELKQDREQSKSEKYGVF